MGGKNCRLVSKMVGDVKWEVGKSKFLSKA